MSSLLSVADGFCVDAFSFERALTIEYSPFYLFLILFLARGTFVIVFCEKRKMMEEYLETAGEHQFEDVEVDVILNPMHEPGPSKKERKRTIARLYTDEECFGLIGAVEKRECLWNIASQAYKNRNANQIAWEQVAEEMSIPKDDLILKWSLLRQQFRVNIKDFVLIHCAILKYISKTILERVFEDEGNQKWSGSNTQSAA